MPAVADCAEEVPVTDAMRTRHRPHRPGPSSRLVVLAAAAVAVLLAVSVPAPMGAAVTVAAAQPTPAAACTVAPRTPAEVAAVVTAGLATPHAHDHDGDRGHDAGHAVAASPAAPGAPDVTAPAPAASPAGPGSTASPTPVREPTGPGRLREITLPEGDPAPPEAVAAMLATLDQFVACANAGDSLRLMALVTDDYLRGGFGDTGLTKADVAAFVGTPSPIAPEDQRVVAGIREARLLPGGQAGALVDLAAVAGPVPGEIRTDFVVFQPDADPTLYRIAAYAAGLPPDRFGPAATPTP
jgi:hypothetical protein